MKIVIDTDTGRLMAAGPDGVRELALSSPAGMEILSRLIRPAGSSETEQPGRSWFGQPIQETADELIRLQDLIFQIQPHVIVQTGKTQSGSLLFLATILHRLGGGKVIGVNSGIGPDVQQVFSQQDWAAGILLIDGNMVADETFSQMKHAISTETRALVILGSGSTKAEIRQELEAFASIVNVGSALMPRINRLQDVLDLGRGPSPENDERPAAAFLQFALDHFEFRFEPSGCLQRVK